MLKGQLINLRERGKVGHRNSKIGSTPANTVSTPALSINSLRLLARRLTRQSKYVLLFVVVEILKHDMSTFPPAGVLCTD